ncbi:MAG: hypothetical protein A2167_00855 [Planctomycetes bacterium RBG_13_46_10]|nr:MAG: hypothetical protein A2167_00855 [Planctomycetes bacterium RBG_13_46_10]
MRDEQNKKSKPQKKTAVRLLKWGLAVIIVLIVLVFLLIPVVVSSETGRRVILSKVNKSVGGRTDFADLSMGWTKGIRITDLSFNDDAGWAQVQVAQIVTKPNYGSLILGNLSFGKTTIDQPEINLNLKNKPVAEPESPGEQQSIPMEIVPATLIINVVVNDGNLKVTDSKDRTVEVSQINSSFNIRPPGQQSLLEADMIIADTNSKINASAQVTPGSKTGWSLKGTSGDFSVEIDGLNLATLAPILELAKVDLQAQGVVSANITSAVIDGRLENLTANVKATNLDVTGSALKGDKLHTNNLDAEVKMSQKGQAINIDQLRFRSDWAQAEAAGTVPTTFKSLNDILQPDSNYNLKGNFNCDVAAILSQMPKTIGLKEGMLVNSGRLSGSVSTFTAAGKATISGQASLTDLAGTVDGKKLAISEPVAVAVEITGRKDRINFDKANVTAAFAKINAGGSLEQINYDGQVDLAKLQAELGQFVNIGPYQMAGQLSGKGQVSVKDDKIAAVGSSTVKELRLSSKEGITASEPAADISFNINYDKKSNDLAIGSLNANTSLGQVNLKDAVVPLGKEAAKPVKLLCSAQKINLEKLQPFLVLFASFPKDMQLAGVAESVLSVTSEKDTYRIFTDSTKIANFKLASPNKEPFQQTEVQLMLDAEVNPGQKAINVKNLELLSPQIKIKKGQFNKTDKEGKTTLQGQANLEYDWSGVSSFVSAFLPQGLEMAGQRKDTISFSSEYPVGHTDQLMANLSSKAKIGFEKANYLGLNFSPTEVDIQIRNGLLDIAPFSSSVNNGQVSFAGRADFKQKPTILKTPGPIDVAKNIQINKETAEKLLMYVNPIFANAVNVSGLANFNCQKLSIPLAANAQKDIEVIGTISVSKLQLQASDLLGQILSVVGGGAQGEVITIHPTNFALQNGFLRYDDMQVDVGNNPINFKGVIGLDQSLDMMVTLPYTASGRTVRVGSQTEGNRITLPLKGTITKPKLDTAKLLEQQIQQQLEEQIRKGLEGIFR